MPIAIIVSGRQSVSNPVITVVKAPGLVIQRITIYIKVNKLLYPYNIVFYQKKKHHIKNVYRLVDFTTCM